MFNITIKLRVRLRRFPEVLHNAGGGKDMNTIFGRTVIIICRRKRSGNTRRAGFDSPLLLFQYEIPRPGLPSRPQRRQFKIGRAEFVLL